MALNSARRSFNFMVYGPLPPEGTNVLWMDSSKPDTPVLKIFWNGAWTSVNTDNNKTIELLVNTVYEQQGEIHKLEDSIELQVTDIHDEMNKIDEEKFSVFTFANTLINAEGVINFIKIHHTVPSGTDRSTIPQNAPALKTGKVYKILFEDGTYHNRIEWVLTDNRFVYSESDVAGAAIYLQKEDEEPSIYEYTIANPSFISIATTGELAQGITAVREDISHIDIDTSTLAKENSVKDGNDTTISVSKEVRSEVGTSSDTASENGTLFAIVKWIKNKVNAITGYALQGSDANANISDIQALIGYTISEIDGV